MIEISGQEHNIETWALTERNVPDRLRVTRKVKISDRILHFGFEFQLSLVADMDEMSLNIGCFSENFAPVGYGLRKHTLLRTYDERVHAIIRENE